MGRAGAAAVAARMAGAGLLIPIPNSGPRPPRRPRQAGDQQLTPRPAVPRSPGPAPRSPGRCLANGSARRMADRGRWQPADRRRVPGRPIPGGAEIGRPGWDWTGRRARPGGIGRPVSVCLDGCQAAGQLPVGPAAVRPGPAGPVRLDLAALAGLVPAGQITAGAGSGGPVPGGAGPVRPVPVRSAPAVCQDRPGRAGAVSAGSAAGWH